MRPVVEKVKIGKGKFEGIQACANEKGVIAALAFDQRHTLRNALDAARGSKGPVTDADMYEFKAAVVKALSPYASSLLIDLGYGSEALKGRAPHVGLLLTYEKTGYDVTVKGRMPDLIPELSVRRLVERGAQGIKILVHYNPNDVPEINEVKKAFVERVGAECAAVDIPLFLEPIAYDESITGGDAQTLEFARKKPEYVIRYMEEFSKPRYGVDVLKVEMPVNMKFVNGTRSFAGGEAAYSREEALEHFKNAAQAAKKPFIYLSAAVRGEIFIESLELAAEANVPYSGVLCGRATWQDAIPIYANEGLPALQTWLESRGVENIQALNAVLNQGAQSIWTLYGGAENLEVV
ncbi:MAG: Tagatose-bisphosphate aldolase [Chloroflexi bacterium]|nr:Tagatose-bisphosphate aldolase [Chloroflexota bacterium]